MIPTYGAGDHLEATLHSVLREAPPDSQIEVVDDASPGGGPERVLHLIDDERIGLHRQAANVGHARNFTTCIRRSRGELVHLLHDDDIVLEGFYQRMDELLRQFPSAGAAICRHTVVDDSGIQRALGPLLRSEPGVLDDWLETIAAGQLVQPPAVVVARSVYERIGGFDEEIRRYGEDWEMWVRVAGATPVAYEPTPLAGYRKRTAGSLSDERHVREQMRDMRAAMRKNRDTMARHGVSTSRLDEIDAQARRSLSSGLVRRARRRRGGGSVPAALHLLEAVRIRPSPMTAASALRAAGHLVLVHRPPPPMSPWSPTPSGSATAAALLAEAPASISNAIDGEPTEAVSSVQGHVQLRLPGVGMVHVFDRSDPGLDRILDRRRAIESLDLPGVPSSLVRCSTVDRVWEVEQPLPGRALQPGEAPARFQAVAARLVAIGGPPGPALRSTPYWEDRVPAAVAVLPHHARPTVERAWERLATVPARVVHGALWPANVMVGHSGVGIIGWHTPERHGPAGLDAVFLALVSSRNEGEMIALASRLASDAPHDEPVGLREALSGLGLGHDSIPAAVVAFLSIYALDELERSSGAESTEHHPTPFRAALDHALRARGAPV